MKVLRIADELHKKLKAEAGSEGVTLQVLVENKLDKGITSTPRPYLEEVEVTTVPSLPTKKNNFKTPQVEKFNPLSKMEKDCCQVGTQCTHWSYGLSGWKNELSGRVR